jgi:hypothetical protein
MGRFLILLATVLLLPSGPVREVTGVSAKLNAQRGDPRTQTPERAPRDPRTQAPARPSPPITLPAPAPAPAPAPGPASRDDGRHSIINADGDIETTFPDGTKKISRPGGCGGTTISPKGTKSVSSCAQSQPATPPLPTAEAAIWLDKHNATLLELMKAVLRNDQTSIDNYLRKNETPQQSVYEKISKRTDAIFKLSN